MHAFSSLNIYKHFSVCLDFVLEDFEYVRGDFSFNLSKNINCSFGLLLAIFFYKYFFFLQSGVGIVHAKPRTLVKASEICCTENSPENQELLWSVTDTDMIYTLGQFMCLCISFHSTVKGWQEHLPLRNVLRCD